MNELTLEQPIKAKKANLALRFVIAAALAVILSVCIMTGAAYYYLRSTAVDSQMQISGPDLVEDLRKVVDFRRLEQPDEGQASALNAIRKSHNLESLALLTANSRVVWPSLPASPLTAEERSLFDSVLRAAVPAPEVLDPMVGSTEELRDVFAARFKPLVAFTPVLDKKNRVLAVVKAHHHFDSALLQAGITTLKLFLVFLLGHLLLMLVSYLNFRRSMITIEKQEIKMNEQIARLSNLLALNKSMQKSMKTASSRAVELNEHFLRRVGADLHDGPAQSIGYSVLRLNQVSKMKESKKLGHEFHAVREALDSALTEIRGISSGLVLPELDEMTLEQCLNRVVSRHQSNADTKVSEYYQNLPDQLPMPIKICAYRFVQEGLNNASRHGQAEKCRVTAHVKDDVLHLSLKDNGMGFRKSQLSTEGGHLGLMGLKDRIESLGGKFSINSELGVGTAIKVSISLVDDV